MPNLATDLAESLAIDLATNLAPGASLPLDAIPETNLRGAYSFRRLRTAYTGDAFRLRRDSDSAEIDIGFDADGFADTAAIESHCSGTDGYVATWYDQSGNGRDVTASGAGAQPLVYDTSDGGLILTDGHLSCYFAAASDYFSSATNDDGWGLSGTNPSADVFWVGASRTALTDGWSVGDAGVGSRFAQRLEQHNQLSLRFGNGHHIFNTETTPMGRLSSLSYRRPLNATHADHDCWQSNVSLASGTIGNPTNTISVTAGAGSEVIGADGGPTATALGQRCAEFILYGSASGANSLSAADAETIRANLAAYYDNDFTEYMTDAGYEALWDASVISDTSEVPATGESGVESWTDRTGNHAATQTTGNDRPKIDDPISRANGYGGIEFFHSSLTQQMEVASLDIASTDTYAIFGVVNVTAINFNALWGVEDGSATEQILCRVNNTTGTLTHFRNALGANHTSVGAISAGSPVRVMFAYDGTNSILRVEGASEESAAIAAGSHSGGGSVMGARADATRTQTWRGHTYAIAVYKNGTLPATADARALAWADLGARFGFDYLSISGVEARFDTADETDISTSGTDVTSWADTTGTYTASTASNYPEFPSSSTANGYRGVYFGAATSERLDNAPVVAAGDTFTLFCVAKLKFSSTYQTLLSCTESGGAEDILLTINNVGKAYVFRDMSVASAVHQTTAALTDDTLSRIMFCYDGTNSVLRVEGAAEESQALTTGAGLAGAGRIGLRLVSNLRGLNGDLFSWCLYKNHAMDTDATQRNVIWQDLGKRFGL